jgi:hypothetical protein
MKASRLNVDLRLLGAGLLAATVALVVLLVTSPPERTSILSAGSDLPAGVPFNELDIELREVEDVAGLVVAGMDGGLHAHVLTAPLAAGSPIPRSLLAAPEEGRGSDLLGLDLDSAAAVHGWLHAGDLVDVYAIGEEVTRIAEDVSVVDVVTDSTSLGSGRVRVVLAVSDELGAGLLTAIGRGADPYLVRKGD